MYSVLNTLLADVRKKRKQLRSVEGKSEFKAQLNLLSQSLLNFIDLADTIKKCEEFLAKLLVQLEELEGKFSDFEEFIEEIETKREDIYNAFLISKMEKGFFHGHTYSANPTSCTAALASLELLVSDEIQEGIKMITSSHQQFISKIKEHPKVKSARQQGVIVALDLNVETDRYGNLRYRLFDFYMKRGVYLRPLGNTVYILAPYIISKEQLEKVYKAIEDSFEII